MQCRSTLTRIDALRTGELDKKEKHRVEEHLKTCTTCHESVEDIERFAEVAKALVRRPPRSCLSRLNEELEDRFGLITTRDERVWVAFSDRGIRMIDLAAGTAEEFERKYRMKFDRGLRQATLPSAYRQQILAALEGKPPRDPEVDLSDVTPFERSVLRTILRIPRGEVRPYAWVARQVRRPKASRAIGNVMAHNPIPLLLPCHRVVPTSGGVGSYAYGPEKKRTLLEREGVAVRRLEELSRTGARYLGSKSTRVFCIPSCHHAARIRAENQVALRSEREARRQGFRPCQRCRP